MCILQFGDAFANGLNQVRGGARRGQFTANNAREVLPDELGLRGCRLQVCTRIGKRRGHVPSLLLLLSKSSHRVIENAAHLQPRFLTQRLRPNRGIHLLSVGNRNLEGLELRCKVSE